MQLLVELLQTISAELDRVDGVLDHDLLRRMIEPLIGEPARMRPSPVLATSIDPAMAQ
jgi:hypothetical protein